MSTSGPVTPGRFLARTFTMPAFGPPNPTYATLVSSGLNNRGTMTSVESCRRVGMSVLTSSHAIRRPAAIASAEAAVPSIKLFAIVRTAIGRRTYSQFSSVNSAPGAPGPTFRNAPNAMKARGGMTSRHNSISSPLASPSSASPGRSKLVSWNRGSFTKSAHAGEDLIRRLQPDEGLGVFVAGGAVDADGVLELAGAAVRPAAQLLLGETGEPALDLVDPGRVGGREVHVEARVGGQPAPDERGLVGPVVVDDQVHLQVGGGLGG